jgi:hypothetical protein
MFSFLCGAGNFGKIWSAYGQSEILYAERRISVFTCSYFVVRVLNACPENW